MAEYSQVELSSQSRLRYFGSVGKHLRRYLDHSAITHVVPSRQHRARQKIELVSFVNESLLNLIP